MGEFAISPEVEPGWRFEATELARLIEARWPEARTAVDDLPGSPMIMHALVSLDGNRRELGIALDPSGNAVVLDPADPDSAVEFALWYITQVPTLDPPVYLYSEGYARSVALHTDMTPTELRDVIA